MITISKEQARKLFLVKQHLVGEPEPGGFHEHVKSLISDIGFIQWDPVTIVAPSHVISLWSRIGNFDWDDLESMMWESKEIFLYYAPVAFIVLTEDYPIFNSLMKDYPESLGDAWRNHIEPARKFLDSHEELRSRVLKSLANGPVDSRTLNDLGRKSKSVDGWTTGNEVTRMLTQLHMLGDVMVSGHSGNQNVWSLTNQFLPAWAKQDVLSVNELEKCTAMRSLKALGVASDFDINRYFVRGRYRNLGETLRKMESDDLITEINLENQKGRRKYYILPADLQSVDGLDSYDWESNMKIIAPFDNIISTRERAERLFDFKYALEQFLPREKRRYGTYVLPYLWKDRLAGRIDAKLQKGSRVLNIISIFAEPGYEHQYEIPGKLSEVLHNFAEFIGAEQVEFGDNLPKGWGRWLKK